METQDSNSATGKTQGANNSAPSAELLLKEINFKDYISSAGELSNVNAKCTKVIEIQNKADSAASGHISEALEFIKAIWAKYDCVEIAEIYDKFVRVEEALFGLERDEKERKRYREHFVHMFNCYIFGLRIISSIITQSTPEFAQKWLKIKDESWENTGLKFGNYSYKQRAFYLWTLIATFHDIAIPFQHLSGMGKGLNKFVEVFGWDLSPPQVRMKDFDAAQLPYYFDLLAGIYGGGLKMDDKGQRYNRSGTPHFYLKKILGRDFDLGNHSVLSGYFLWKTIEGIFLLRKSAKHNLSMDEFNKYTELVLEQDIARAALAMSLHSLRSYTNRNGEDELPQIYPIKFEEFPLAFLLILADELQEYNRWEGTSIGRGLKFSGHPLLTLEINSTENEPEFYLHATFSIDSTNKNYILDQAKNGAIFQKKNPNEIENFEQAVVFIGNNIKETIERKICLGYRFKLHFKILQDWDTHKQLYSRDFETKAAT